MRYAVTGVSRELTTEERILIITTLDMLTRSPTEIITGCAHGVDSAAHQAAVELYPGVRKVLMAPAAPHNSRLIKMANLPSISWEVVEAPQGKTDAESYMLRNDLLVERCEVLIAFPETANELVRSGTWATVRRARRAGRPVMLQPLSLATGLGIGGVDAPLRPQEHV